MESEDAEIILPDPAYLIVDLPTSYNLTISDMSDMITSLILDPVCTLPIYQESLYLVH
jgi:hypothetical protein